MTRDARGRLRGVFAAGVWWPRVGGWGEWVGRFEKEGESRRIDPLVVGSPCGAG